MSDDPALDLLLAIRADMAEIRADIEDLKERTWLMQGSLAFLSRRMDHMAGTMALVRRRLGPTDAD